MTDLRIFTAWFKSSDSTPSDNCVEAAFADDGSGAVAVRNSKDPRQVTVVFNAGEWDAFLAGAKRGEFDRA